MRTRQRSPSELPAKRSRSIVPPCMSDACASSATLSGRHDADPRASTSSNRALRSLASTAASVPSVTAREAAADDADSVASIVAASRAAPNVHAPRSSAAESIATAPLRCMPSDAGAVWSSTVSREPLPNTSCVATCQRPRAAAKSIADPSISRDPGVQTSSGHAVGSSTDSNATSASRIRACDAKVASADRAAATGAGRDAAWRRAAPIETTSSTGRASNTDRHEKSSTERLAEKRISRDGSANSRSSSPRASVKGENRTSPARAMRSLRSAVNCSSSCCTMRAASRGATTT